VNREKSPIRHAAQATLPGFGFFFDGPRVGIRIAPQAIARLKDQLRMLTRRRWSVSMDYRIGRLNRLITGSPGAAILLHDVVLTGRLARFCGVSPRVWCSWLVVVHAAQREIGGSGDAGFPGEDAVGGEVLDGAGRGAGRGGGR
jgi:hypothetical protein